MVERSLQGLDPTQLGSWQTRSGSPDLQLADAGRAEVSAIDQVVGVRRAVGGASVHSSGPLSPQGTENKCPEQQLWDMWTGGMSSD